MTKILVDEIQAPGGKPFKVSKIGGVLGGGGGGGAEIVEVTTLPDATTAGSVGDQVIFESDIYRYMEENADGHLWKGITTNYTSQPPPIGQKLFKYDDIGSHTWVVPDGVSSICVVLVGGGAQGIGSWSGPGGNGAALAYANDIPVTPGESLDIFTGNGATGVNTAGEDTTISQSGGILFTAEGGKANGTSTRANFIGGTITCLGGTGGLSDYVAGGGAGGYSGGGGDAATQYGMSSTGRPAAGGAGGGGGGYQSSTYAGGGGGGVGLYGEGTSGANGDVNNGNSWYSDGRYGGDGGSGGFEGGDNPGGSSQSRTDDFGNTITIQHAQGGHYGGGGGGGGTSLGSSSTFCRGGNGGARIIWGEGRSFPSTLTTDQ